MPKGHGSAVEGKAKPVSSINARLDKKREAQLLRCDHCWEAQKQRKRFYRSRGALVKHLSTCAKRKTAEELIRNEEARIKGLAELIKKARLYKRKRGQTLEGLKQEQEELFRYVNDLYGK